MGLWCRRILTWRLERAIGCAKVTLAFREIRFGASRHLDYCYPQHHMDVIDFTYRAPEKQGGGSCHP